jgi:hypothetical protein
LLRLGFSPGGAVLCLLLVTGGMIMFALSDFLAAPWLGLPGMGAWMIAAQLGALQHLKNRQHGLDLFSEIFYAVGFDDRIDKMNGGIGSNVADIIDLQAERAKVESSRLVRDGTTGNETVVPAGADDSDGAV